MNAAAGRTWKFPAEQPGVSLAAIKRIEGATVFGAFVKFRLAEAENVMERMQALSAPASSFHWRMNCQRSQE
jgi:hypothetical protein